jgi:dipeptidyl aminopeptidase/acylaminoacyl peptidase
MGHSMGGGVALKTMVIAPEAIDAYVLYAPVSGDEWDNFERYISRYGINNAGTEIPKRYGLPEENPEFWREVSAINYFHLITSPIQIYHGTGDEDVPFSWSEKLSEVLSAVLVDYEFIVYKDAPHEFIPPEWGWMMEDTLEFFNKHLK